MSTGRLIFIFIISPIAILMGGLVTYGVTIKGGEEGPLVLAGPAFMMFGFGLMYICINSPNENTGQRKPTIAYADSLAAKDRKGCWLFVAGGAVVGIITWIFMEDFLWFLGFTSVGLVWALVLHWYAGEGGYTESHMTGGHTIHTKACPHCDTRLRGTEILAENNSVFTCPECDNAIST